MNPPHPKIIFFDIDETLYSHRLQCVPPSAQAALHTLKRQGIATAIATGRSTATLPPPIRTLIAETGIDIIVSINGQHVTHQGKALASFALDTDSTHRLSGSLKTLGIAHAAVDDSGIFAILTDQHLRTALSSLGIGYTHDPQALSRPVRQMLAFYPAARNAEVAKILPDSFKTVRWHEYGTDILDKSGSKARGIQAALNKLGLDRQDAMAFGDGLNDLEMMGAAGFGIAMGNAVPELKAAADYVCPRADEDGIWHALTDLGVIQAA